VGRKKKGKGPRGLQKLMGGRGRPKRFKGVPKVSKRKRTEKPANVGTVLTLSQWFILWGEGVRQENETRAIRRVDTPPRPGGRKNIERLRTHHKGKTRREIAQAKKKRPQRKQKGELGALKPPGRGGKTKKVVVGR